MKTVIEMAREAGFKEHNGVIYVTTINDDCAKELKAFAALVRADEREKRDEAVGLLNTIHMGNESTRSQNIIRSAIRVLQRNAPEELAAAIRARRSNP
jgi:hypothetical protein